MFLLKVKLHGSVVTEFPLSTDKECIVGRKAECDVVLGPEQGISREHFKVVFVNNEWQVQVISRYGEVFVNGVTQTQFSLSEGDVFAVPPYEFQFLRSEQGRVNPSSQAVESFAAPESFDHLPVNYESAGEDGEFHGNSDRTVVGAAPLEAYIKIVDALNDVKELLRLSSGDVWVAGRDASCQIQIKDQRVSRKQFEIRRNGSEFLIIDLGSVNGTLVNGTPISPSETTLLRSGDAIAVLDNYLYFELHDAQFQNRLGNLKAEPMGPLVPYQASIESYQNQNQYQYPDQYQNNGPAPFPQASVSTATSDVGQFKKFDFEKHRKKLIIGVVAFFLVAVIVSENGSETAPPTTGSVSVAPGSAADIFSKLKPEEQALIKQRYKDAKNLYMQGRYQLAQDEIVKIHEFVPEFEDTREIERLAKEAIVIQEQQRRQEELEKARVETELRIENQLKVCAQKMSPTLTMSELDSCVQSILEFDPENSGVQALRDQVLTYEADRQASEEKREDYRRRVAQLKGLFDRSKMAEKSGNALAAIAAYEKVKKSSLPDPHGYKAQATRAIGVIREQMNVKTASLQAEAERSYQSQNLKGAILALRKARSIDPTNDELTQKIDRYILELRKQMMVLYQEGILEESFGNVEGGESKTGAKDKWRKILDTDIPDGEYYKKSFLKLKKYGG